MCHVTYIQKSCVSHPGGHVCQITWSPSRARALSHAEAHYRACAHISCARPRSLSASFSSSMFSSSSFSSCIFSTLVSEFLIRRLDRLVGGAPFHSSFDFPPIVGGNGGFEYGDCLSGGFAFCECLHYLFYVHVYTIRVFERVYEVETFV